MVPTIVGFKGLQVKKKAHHVTIPNCLQMLVPCSVAHTSFRHGPVCCLVFFGRQTLAQVMLFATLHLEQPRSPVPGHVASMQTVRFSTLQYAIMKPPRGNGPSKFLALK